jgi:hypothetical protein
VELVVVVVFNHGDAFPDRKLEKDRPARTGQGHGSGVLMVRRDIDGGDGSPCEQPLEGCDINAMLVDPNGDDFGASAAKRFPRGPVTRILDGNRITRAKQRASGERQRHLASTSHDDRIRLHCQASRRRQHHCQRMAKARDTRRIAVRQE